MLTCKGKTEPQAAAFVEFLESAAGQKIFAKWGWDTRSAVTVGGAGPMHR